jgi:addiction module HigA family antidote
MAKIQIERKPTSPGEVLAEEFLKPMQITQKKFADHIGVDIKVINRLINGKTSLSPELALKFAASFDTTAEFWLSFQYEIDLYLARKNISRLPSKIA